MPGTQPKRIWPFGLLFLSALSVAQPADQRTPADYAATKPLLLEIRYCECPATVIDSAPSGLLPDFLMESRALKVAVLAEDTGFIASPELSMGYDLEPLQGSPGTFRFEYAGSFLTSDGESTGQAKLLLVEGQWAIIFGTRRDSESGPQHTSVALRLVEMGSS